jgi:hypothetical protein
MKSTRKQRLAAKIEAGRGKGKPTPKRDSQRKRTERDAKSQGGNG